MSSPEVQLLVDEEQFEKWVSFEVESNILQPADAFSFVAPNVAGEMAGKISKFDSVQVAVDGEVVMVGFVDDINYSNQQVEIAGRDLFGHLVDCSAEPKTYKNMTLLTLAQTLSAAWVPTWSVGVGVTLPLHRRIKVEPGSSVMDALLKVAKKDRVLIWLDETGAGVIGRPDYNQLPSHSLRYFTTRPNTNNILAQDVAESGRDQFSNITVIGTSGNTSGQWGKTALQKQSAAEAEVSTTRPLIMTNGDVKSITQARDLAENEVERRAFDALVMRYRVQGFYGDPPEGGTRALFQADQIVSVEDQYAAVEGLFYMTARRFTLGEDGHITNLELHPQGWMA